MSLITQILDLLHKPTKQNRTFWSYLGGVILQTILIAFFNIFTIIRFRNIFKEKALNIYRILQLSMLLLYMTLVIVTSFLKFANYPLYGYLLHIYIWFAYFYAEIINITWWVNFKILMNSYSDCSKVQNSFKEKVLIFILILIPTLYLLPCLVLTILGFTNNWSQWNPFDYKTWENGWIGVAKAYRTSFDILASILLLIVIFKILSGVLVLIGMK